MEDGSRLNFCQLQRLIVRRSAEAEERKKKSQGIHRKENTATDAATVFPRGLKHSDSYMGITLGLLLFSLTSLISWGSLCLSNIHLLAVPSHVSVLMVQMPPPGLISLPLSLPTILIHHRIQHNLLCRSAPTSPWGAWEGGTQGLCPEILSQEGNQKSQKSLLSPHASFSWEGEESVYLQPSTLQVATSSCVNPFSCSRKDNT